MQSRLILLIIILIAMVGITSADTLLKYPDIDGYADDTTSSAYATLRADTGAAAASGSTTTVNAPLIDSAATSPNFHIFRRAILSFNTSSLPDDATISSAKFGLYITAIENGLGSPAYGITGGTLASNTAIAAGDYDGFGNTRYANDIAYASITTSARNNWTLNAAGIANISKTGYTVIYFRDAWDIDNSAPTYAKSVTTSITWNPVGYTGTANDPFLEIVYTASPVAAFSANVTSGCPPLSVAFTDASTNTPTTWDWRWWANETTSSTSQNPTYTFPAGTYNVRLYSSNAVGGDWENKSSYISTTAAPVGAFTKDKSSGDAPLTVTFTDTSTGSPTSWLWVFGDGSSENNTQQNPIHTFSSAGTYNANLTATNCGGSNTTSTQSITVTTYIPPSDPFNASHFNNWTDFYVNSTTALTNYQVKMILDNQTGASAPGIFYTNGTTRATWEDVAWTDTSNATLGFWKENRTDTATNTTWWIKVPSIASDNTTKIRLFYGNTSKTTSYMDGTNTFLFFDDFNEATLNTTKWTASANTTISNSEVILSPSSSTPNTVPVSYIQSAYNGTYYSMAYRMKPFATNDKSRIGMADRVNTYFSEVGAINTIGIECFSDGNLYTDTNSGGLNQVAQTTYTAAYHKYQIDWRNGNVDFYYDGTKYTHTTKIPTIALKPLIRDKLSLDWAFIRNYTTVEPFLTLSTGGAAPPPSPPVASFTVNRNPARIPQSITVTDTSTNTPTSWQWSWGDGSSNSTTQNPSHTYSTRGRFNIILTATNADGSGTNSGNYIRVVGYENYY